MAVSKAEPGKTRIGWIGTGVMGRWMCHHLMSKGHSATVYTRSRDKAKPLLDAGAAWADSPKAAAERSDVVFAIEWQQGRQRAGGHDHQRTVAGP
jgi:3-hydroxyisobutyrate dehydrogenase